MEKIIVFIAFLLATSTIFAQMPEKDQDACEYARKNDNAKNWLDYVSKFPDGKCLAEAQFSLGLIYQEGNGVSQDSSEVFKWYNGSNMQPTRAQTKQNPIS